MPCGGFLFVIGHGEAAAFASPADLIAGLFQLGHADREHGDPGAGHELRCGEGADRRPPCQQRRRATAAHEHGTEQDEEPGGGQVAEPVGGAGPEEVHGEQAQRHQAEGLGGAAQVAPAHPRRQCAGDGGETEERRGPGTHAHRRPGDGQEHQRGHQQAHRAEPEQDLGHRRGAEPVPARGAGHGQVASDDLGARLGALGEAWRPWRSVASFYLWRSRRT